MRVILSTALLLALGAPAMAQGPTQDPAPAQSPAAIRPLAGDGFAAPPVLESGYGGDWRRLAYVPLAESERVAAALLAAGPAPQTLTVESGGAVPKHIVAGDPSKPAQMILVYLHGLGDGRAQGMDETRFGGAFARLKRLAVANDALYISPDFSGFGRKAERQVAALIADYAGRHPGAPVFVACLSAGGRVCWRLARNADAVPALRGVLLLGAGADRDFAKRVTGSRIKIYLAVGTKDKLANWKSHDVLFRRIKAAAPDYPVRLTIFDSGEHATAMRLTDWVATLGWMLAGTAGTPR
jgi:hypothetical protein